MGIELPPLNIALVEVHRELATVRNGTKDMFCKNKTVRKAENFAKQQLEETQHKIAELERYLQKTTTNIAASFEVQRLQEDVEAQTPRQRKRQNMPK